MGKLDVEWPTVCEVITDHSKEKDAVDVEVKTTENVIKTTGVLIRSKKFCFDLLKFVIGMESHGVSSKK